MRNEVGVGGVGPRPKPEATMAQAGGPRAWLKRLCFCGIPDQRHSQDFMDTQSTAHTSSRKTDAAAASDLADSHVGLNTTILLSIRASAPGREDDPTGCTDGPPADFTTGERHDQQPHLLLSTLTFGVNTPIAAPCRAASNAGSESATAAVAAALSTAAVTAAYQYCHSSYAINTPVLAQPSPSSPAARQSTGGQPGTYIDLPTVGSGSLPGTTPFVFSPLGRGGRTAEPGGESPPFQPTRTLTPTSEGPAVGPDPTAVVSLDAQVPDQHVIEPGLRPGHSTADGLHLQPSPGPFPAPRDAVPASSAPAGFSASAGASYRRRAGTGSGAATSAGPDLGFAAAAAAANEFSRASAQSLTVWSLRRDDLPFAVAAAAANNNNSVCGGPRLEEVRGLTHGHASAPVLPHTHDHPYLAPPSPPDGVGVGVGVGAGTARALTSHPHPHSRAYPHHHADAHHPPRSRRASAMEDLSAQLSPPYQGAFHRSSGPGSGPLSGQLPRSSATGFQRGGDGAPYAGCAASTCLPAVSGSHGAVGCMPHGPQGTAGGATPERGISISGAFAYSAVYTAAPNYNGSSLYYEGLEVGPDGRSARLLGHPSGGVSSLPSNVQYGVSGVGSVGGAGGMYGSMLAGTASMPYALTSPQRSSMGVVPSRVSLSGAGSVLSLPLETGSLCDMTAPQTGLVTEQTALEMCALAPALDLWAAGAHVSPQSRISQGAYGVVYRGSWHGCTCAVKIMLAASTENLSSQLTEVFLCKALSCHPNIVQTFDCNVWRITVETLVAMQSFCGINGGGGGGGLRSGVPPAYLGGGGGGVGLGGAPDSPAAIGGGGLSCLRSAASGWFNASMTTTGGPSGAPSFIGAASASSTIGQNGPGTLVALGSAAMLYGGGAGVGGAGMALGVPAAGTDYLGGPAGLVGPNGGSVGTAACGLAPGGGSTNPSGVGTNALTTAASTSHCAVGSSSAACCAVDVHGRRGSTGMYIESWSLSAGRTYNSQPPQAGAALAAVGGTSPSIMAAMTPYVLAALPDGVPPPGAGSAGDVAAAPAAAAAPPGAVPPPRPRLMQFMAVRQRSGREAGLGVSSAHGPGLGGAATSPAAAAAAGAGHGSEPAPGYGAFAPCLARMLVPVSEEVSMSGGPMTENTSRAFSHLSPTFSQHPNIFDGAGAERLLSAAGAMGSGPSAPSASSGHVTAGDGGGGGGGAASWSVAQQREEGVSGGAAFPAPPAAASAASPKGVESPMAWDQEEGEGAGKDVWDGAAAEAAAAAAAVGGLPPPLLPPHYERSSGREASLADAGPQSQHPEAGGGFPLGGPEDPSGLLLEGADATVTVRHSSPSAVLATAAAAAGATDAPLQVVPDEPSATILVAPASPVAGDDDGGGVPTIEDGICVALGSSPPPPISLAAGSLSTSPAALGAAAAPDAVLPASIDPPAVFSASRLHERLSASAASHGPSQPMDSSDLAASAARAHGEPQPGSTGGAIPQLLPYGNNSAASPFTSQFPALPAGIGAARLPSSSSSGARGYEYRPDVDPSSRGRSPSPMHLSPCDSRTHTPGPSSVAGAGVGMGMGPGGADPLAASASAAYPPGPGHPITGPSLSRPVSGSTPAMGSYGLGHGFGSVGAGMATGAGYGAVHGGGHGYGYGYGMQLGPGTGVISSPVSSGVLPPSIQPGSASGASRLPSDRAFRSSMNWGAAGGGGGGAGGSLGAALGLGMGLSPAPLQSRNAVATGDESDAAAALSGARNLAQVLSSLGAREGQLAVLVVMEECDRGSLQQLLSKSAPLAAARAGAGGAGSGGGVDGGGGGGSAAGPAPGSGLYVPFSGGGRYGPQAALRALVTTAKEVALGMAFLHVNNIIHGDLKPGNVLLKSSRQDQRGFIVKISDFGLSRVLHPNGGQLLFAAGGADSCALDGGGGGGWGAGGEEDESRASTVYAALDGTVPYLAPELFESGQRSKSSDVWAYGVLLWQLVTGRRPYEGYMEVQIMAALCAPPVSEAEEPLKWPTEAHQGLVKLGRACLSHNPRERPTFAQIVRRLQALEGELRG